MHGRNYSVKFAFKKNLKHVVIHKYVRYKFKEERMLCSNNRIFNSNLLSHTQIGDLTDIEGCRKDLTCIISFNVWANLGASYF